MLHVTSKKKKFPSFVLLRGPTWTMGDYSTSKQVSKEKSKLKYDKLIKPEEMYRK
jgi:hypothetical protein